MYLPSRSHSVRLLTVAYQLPVVSGRKAKFEVGVCGRFVIVDRIVTPAAAMRRQATSWISRAMGKRRPVPKARAENLEDGGGLAALVLGEADAAQDVGDGGVSKPRATISARVSCRSVHSRIGRAVRSRAGGPGRSGWGAALRMAAAPSGMSRLWRGRGRIPRLLELGRRSAPGRRTGRRTGWIGEPACWRMPSAADLRSPRR